MNKNVTLTVNKVESPKILGTECKAGKVYECVEEGYASFDKGSLFLAVKRSSDNEVYLLCFDDMEIFKPTSSRVYYIERPDITDINIKVPF